MLHVCDIILHVVPLQHTYLRVCVRTHLCTLYVWCVCVCVFIMHTTCDLCYHMVHAWFVSVVLAFLLSSFMYVIFIRSMMLHNYY